MALFGKKKEAVNKEPVAMSGRVRAEDALPGDPDAPWVLAQRHHDDRFLRMAAQTKNWRTFAFISLASTVCAVVGIAYIGAQWRVTPVFIEVDKLGRTQAMVAGVVEGAKIDPKQLIYREMREFIENTRTVTSDYGANNKALTLAFSRLIKAGYGYVKDDLMTHKPNEVAEKKTIAVEVKLAMPITDGAQRNSWQVEWSETSYDLKGSAMGPPEMWKANIQYELHQSADVEEVMKNPLGFYIPSLSWSKMM